MISISEIDKTILDLEAHDTTFATCEKLAWLYVVRDHLVKPGQAEQVQMLAGSDFLDAVSGKDVGAVLGVISEHFEVVAVLMPREYEAVIDRIKAL